MNPHEILLVADAALGQEAVNVAKTFHERLSLTGIVLTKVDGDARGGAALSMKKVTGAPIKFLGVGEKIDEFEVFHPDRLASRILGMGDVVSLVEKAQENLDQEESMRMAEKMLKAEFDFEDFLTQMKQMKKMGSMGSVAKMLPGMNNAEIGDKEESALGRHEAIILSMTKEERRLPRIIAGSRRKRIAEGAGVQIRDVNQLIKQFSQMQKMMKKMKGGKMKQMMSAWVVAEECPTWQTWIPRNWPNWPSNSRVSLTQGLSIDGTLHAFHESVQSFFSVNPILPDRFFNLKGAVQIREHFTKNVHFLLCEAIIFGQVLENLNRFLHKILVIGFDKCTNMFNQWQLHQRIPSIRPTCLSELD